MITLKDIAKLANVSTATVSYVLNGRGNISDKTRAKVLEIVEAHNYKPNNIAKSLKLNKTSTIGVIVEDITVFSAPEIINGINEYAEENGFTIVLTNLRIHKRIGNHFKDIDRYKHIITAAVDDLLSKQVDGIIYIGVHTRDVKGLIDIAKPVVYVYCYSTLESAYSVNYDDELAALEATNYLIERGHKRIALISGLIDSMPSHGRFNGYYKAIMANQLPFDPSLIKTGDWEYSSGYSMAKELMALPTPPTAILAMNDLMAGGAIDACREINVNIPEQLSVIGFDNREFSGYYSPKITTVDIPLQAMGSRAIAMLIEILDGSPPEESNPKLECRMIERETVAAAADKQ
ncbi:LacI family DNA-binding transcriptional regulator [Paenibacillus sp. PR3]|uniref:LacI family DNA-binding transcriptional regulator n=1 Tax=Paenibacillus terricola TaxID=2763503 RepID=A0ABR8MYV1_9BACL|nr:LacI family DNA-binding transcriptional regulator [Paenibacillus terricola]MBD3921063.1 LacI family DNA-binding transcriptional regulator [Paenibacillus terricola]